MKPTAPSKHARAVPKGRFPVKRFRLLDNGLLFNHETGDRWFQFSATKRRPWVVRAENRKRNKAARQARKLNR